MEIITVDDLRNAAAAVRFVAMNNQAHAPSVAAVQFSIVRKLQGLADQMVHYKLDGITVENEYPQCAGCGSTGGLSCGDADCQSVPSPAFASKGGAA